MENDDINGNICNDQKNKYETASYCRGDQQPFFQIGIKPSSKIQLVRVVAWTLTKHGIPDMLQLYNYS